MCRTTIKETDREKQGRSRAKPSEVIKASMFEAEVPFGRKDKKPGQPRVTAERRNWVRKETQRIISQNILAREKTKEDM